MKNVELNRIYQGDNLSFMRSFPEAFIDLIYIDPPFGTQSLWSSKAWGNKVQTELNFYDIFGGGVNGYLNFLIPRLRQCHRLLKPTGILCVHLDWRMSHYVKVELDKIFGVKNPALSNTNFVNEVIWHYQAGTGGKRFYKKKHDTILIYSKNKKHIFNRQGKPVVNPRRYNKIDKDGRLYDINGQGKKYYLDEGQTCDDVWTYLQEKEFQQINSQSKERIGWPTQKPLSLLNRLIKTFSNENDLIADFFCGCGTSIDAAQSLNRKWLGVDAGQTACEVMQKRMEDRHSLFVGIDKKPITLKDFEALEPFEFEKEAVRYIGGVPNEIQTCDGGIDGRLAFDGTPIQVKKEKDALGDVDRFRALYEPAKQHGRGVFITLRALSLKPNKELINGVLRV